MKAGARVSMERCLPAASNPKLVRNSQRAGARIIEWSFYGGFMHGLATLEMAFRFAAVLACRPLLVDSKGSETVGFLARRA